MSSNSFYSVFEFVKLAGCISGELGLRDYLEKNVHELIVTSDKDDPSSEFEKIFQMQKRPTKPWA